MTSQERAKQVLAALVREYIASGEPVRVPRYGDGRVVRSSNEQVEIVFPDGRACLATAGQDWEQIPSKPMGKDS